MAEQLELTPTGDTSSKEPKPLTTESLEAILKERTEPLERSLREEREARIRLEATIEATRTQPQQDSDRRSPEQLSKLVDDGQITQEQADNVLRKQDKDDLKAEMKAEIAASKAESTVEAQINRYTEGIPDVLNEGSEAHKRYTDAYRFHAGISGVPTAGSPADQNMKLASLFSAFGEPNKIVERGGERRPVHVETGGGSGAPPAGGETSNSAFEGIKDPKWQPYYEGAIAEGRYTGPDDPKLTWELNHIRSTQ